jgi:Leucine-rich repeat (LRR) protein
MFKYFIIYLGGNKITNIENIQFMKADKLQELFISDNNISKCKSIRKTNFYL